MVDAAVPELRDVFETLQRAEAGLGARVRQLEEQAQAENAARQAAEALLSEERSARSAETSAWNEAQAAGSVRIVALQEEVEKLQRDGDAARQSATRSGEECMALKEQLSAALAYRRKCISQEKQLEDQAAELALRATEMGHLQARLELQGDEKGNWGARVAELESNLASKERELAALQSEHRHMMKHRELLKEHYKKERAERKHLAALLKSRDAIGGHEAVPDADAPASSMSLTPPAPTPTPPATTNPQSVTPPAGPSHSLRRPATALSANQDLPVSVTGSEAAPPAAGPQDGPLASAASAPALLSIPPADRTLPEAVDTAQVVPAETMGGGDLEDGASLAVTQPNMAAAQPRRRSSGARSKGGPSVEGEERGLGCGGDGDWGQGGGMVGGEGDAEHRIRDRCTSAGETAAGGVCADARIMFPGNEPLPHKGLPANIAALGRALASKGRGAPKEPAPETHMPDSCIPDAAEAIPMAKGQDNAPGADRKGKMPLRTERRGRARGVENRGTPDSREGRSAQPSQDDAAMEVSSTSMAAPAPTPALTPDPSPLRHGNPGAPVPVQQTVLQREVAKGEQAPQETCRAIKQEWRGRYSRRHSAPAEVVEEMIGEEPSPMMGGRGKSGALSAGEKGRRGSDVPKASKLASNKRKSPDPETSPALSDYVLDGRKAPRPSERSQEGLGFNSTSSRIWGGDTWQPRGAAKPSLWGGAVSPSWRERRRDPADATRGWKRPHERCASDDWLEEPASLCRMSKGTSLASPRSDAPSHAASTTVRMHYPGEGRTPQPTRNNPYPSLTQQLQVDPDLTQCSPPSQRGEVYRSTHRQEGLVSGEGVPEGPGSDVQTSEARKLLREGSGVLETLHILDMHQGLTAECSAATPRRQPRQPAERMPTIVERIPQKAPSRLPPGEPGYKYREVVRKKAEREELQGFDCPDCEGFYRAIEAHGPAPGLERPNCGHMKGESLAAVMKQQASRHRYRHAPPATPPGFWNLGFSDEQD